MNSPAGELLRRRFPSLSDGVIYFENAGGSQAPDCVAAALHYHLRRNYVNSGAGYATSQAATQVVRAAHPFINRFMGGDGKGHVALGPSSSILCRMTADSYADTWQPGDEIVVAQNGHEANLGCWHRLERRGLVVRTWPLEPETLSLSVETLKPLLNPRTRMVAFTHVSNILGEVMDIAAITRFIRASCGARVIVDGVAYAPHYLMSVADWDVDWYVYSTYKVFGPHMAALYGKTECFHEIDGANHFFTSREKPQARLELGGACPEGCAGLLALGEYLRFAAAIERGNLHRHGGAAPDSAAEHRGAPATYSARAEAALRALAAGSDAAGDWPLHENADIAREDIVAAWRLFSALETPLTRRLVDFFTSKPRVRLYGPHTADERRVGLVSFTHERLTPAEIVAHTDRAGIGIKHGHMSAYRLVEALGLNPTSGVVRVSIAHYNTLAEVERLIAVLDPIL